MNHYSQIFLQSPIKYGLHSILVMLLFMLVGCSGCSKYKRTELIEGMYYPNGVVKLEGRAVKSVDRVYEITISHPFRVSELGVLTPGWYEEPWRNNHQPFDVGKAEISDAGVYYIPVYMLNSTGRFEYHQRSITIKEWIRDHPIMTALLAGVVLVVLIVWLLKKTSLMRTSGSSSVSNYSGENYGSSEKMEENSSDSAIEMSRAKKAHSKKEENWFGEKRTQHYDEDGNEAGYSKKEENWFGEKRTQHYDEDGNEAGYSKKEENWFGEKRTQDYDESGNEAGYSKTEENWFGEKRIQHYDEDGNRTGHSEWKENWFGEKYLQHYDENGDPID